MVEYIKDLRIDDDGSIDATGATVTGFGSGSGSGKTTEEIEDIVGNLLAAGNAQIVNYDDTNDTLTIAVDESNIAAANLSDISEIADYTATPTEVTGPVNNDRVNAVRYADPGEVQSTIDTVANLSGVGAGGGDAMGVVQLDPTATYTATGIDLKPGVSLAGPALFQPGTDADVLIPDNGTEFGIVGGPLAFDLSNLGTYSSDCIHVDTSQSSLGKYFQENATRGRFEIYGDGTAGQTGLHLDDSGGDAIALNNRFEYNIAGVAIGVKTTTTSAGFINGPKLSGYTEVAGGAAVHYQQNGVDDSTSRLLLDGIIAQVGGITGETVLQNNTTARSFDVSGGQIWDIDVGNGQLLTAGPAINVQVDHINTVNGNPRDAGDGSNNTWLIFPKPTNGRWTIASLNYAKAVYYDAFPNGVSLHDGSGSEAFRVFSGGRVQFPNGVRISTSSAYSPSNVTTDRSFDADNTTVDELADVVGTIIEDLQLDI